MRRRAGADVVDIDTINGTCQYWLLEPRVIDFDALERAAADSSYTLVGITLEIEGDVVGEVGSFELVIPETGQRFPLDGNVKASGRLHVHASASDWKEGRVRLTVVTSHAGASGESGNEIP